MPKKMLWKVGVYSCLSECLIRDGRDSAARRVVSDTDTPKVLLKIGAQKEPSPLCPSLLCHYCTIGGFIDEVGLDLGMAGAESLGAVKAHHHH